MPVFATLKYWLQHMAISSYSEILVAACSYQQQLLLLPELVASGSVQHPKIRRSKSIEDPWENHGTPIENNMVNSLEIHGYSIETHGQILEYPCLF